MTSTRRDLLPPLEPTHSAIEAAQERLRVELQTMGLGIQAEHAERILVVLRELNARRIMGC
ncbi:MAG: hypothetical protein AAFP15_15760 [Bacteroidota bacterium]